MIAETTTTVVGNLVAEPDLKYTTTGTPVATFTIASTPRVFDAGTNKWHDGDALFLRCVVWRRPAERVATLTKGTRLIATGRLKLRAHGSAADRRTVELEVDDVGLSIRYARVAVTRVRSDARDDDASSTDTRVVSPADASIDT